MTTALLINIQYQITVIGYPICIVIGNVGGAIGLFVFLQKSMRRSPCGLFFIAYMITNLLYVNFTILLSALTALFQINLSIQSSIFCRMFYYLSFVFAVIPSYLLSMASIDRSLASSHNVHTRLRSTRRFATLMIASICSFWILFHLHAFFTVNIQFINNIQLVCTFLSGISTTFVTYYNLICVGIIPLSLMVVFGIRILMNIQQARVVRNRLNNNRRLVLILLIQVMIYLCLRLPASLYLIYKQITQFSIKTSDQVLVEQFIQTVVYFCQFIQVSISPLLNFTTKTFRKELKRAWNKVARGNNQPQSMNTIQRQVIRRR
jgi:hypothetical protein